jgi:hypothetical protein
MQFRVQQSDVPSLDTSQAFPRARQQRPDSMPLSGEIACEQIKVSLSQQSWSTAQPPSKLHAQTSSTQTPLVQSLGSKQPCANGCPQTWLQAPEQQAVFPPQASESGTHPP